MKSTHKLLAAAGSACIILAGAAGYAVAELPEGPKMHSGPQAHFSHMDTDGDGQVTQQELQHMKRQHAADMDANADGFVTPEEMQAFKKQKRHSKFLARLDQNGDGRVSVDEFASHEGPFARLDKNGDGVLTADEMQHRRGHHKHMKGSYE